MKTLKEYIYEAQAQAWDLDAKGLSEDIKKMFAKARTKDMFDKAWYALKEWLDGNAKMLDTTVEDFEKNYDKNKTYFLLKIATGGSNKGDHTIKYTAENGQSYGFYWDKSSIWKVLGDGSKPEDGIIYDLKFLSRMKDLRIGYLYEL